MAGSVDYSDELTVGLMSVFSLDETSGLRNDPITAYDLEAVGTYPAAVPGKFGNAVRFTGAGYLKLQGSQTPDFSPAAGGFAVSVWFNVSGNTNSAEYNTYIASVWDEVNYPTGCSWFIACQPSTNLVHVKVVGTGATVLSGNANLQAWAHACLVYDPGGNWRLYLNGQLAGTVAFGYAAVSGWLALAQSNNPTGSPKEGIIDELTIWSRALIPEEVAFLYNGGNGRAYPF
jgi:hypothetical protein